LILSPRGFASRLECHPQEEIAMIQHNHQTAPTEFVDAAGMGGKPFLRHVERRRQRRIPILLNR